MSSENEKNVDTTTYEEKVPELKHHLVAYLKTNEAIKIIKENMQSAFVISQDFHRFGEEVSGLEEKQQEHADIIKYESNVDVQQLLESGKTPLEVMDNIRMGLEKRFQERKPEKQEWRDASEFMELYKTVDHYINKNYPSPERLEKIEKEKAEEIESKPPPEPESPGVPLPSETSTKDVREIVKKTTTYLGLYGATQNSEQDNHQPARGQSEGKYQDLYNEDTHHPRSPDSRGKNRDRGREM
jgi:hypothetical protein